VATTSPKLARKLQTVEAAANYLKVSQRTVRRYIAEGKLTGYRVGGTLVRVQQSDLDALVRPISAAGR
jgi:excisionase family DNA binding protein